MFQKHCVCSSCWQRLASTLESSCVQFTWELIEREKSREVQYQKTNTEKILEDPSNPNQASVQEHVTQGLIITRSKSPESAHQRGSEWLGSRFVMSEVRRAQVKTFQRRRPAGMPTQTRTSRQTSEMLRSALLREVPTKPVTFHRS